MTKIPPTYITRHKSYIDYRLRILSNYVSLKNQNISSSFIHSLITSIINPAEKKCPAQDDKPIHEAINDIKAMAATWDINNDGDLLGYIYQNLEIKNTKKKKGQYFTPPGVVNHIVSTLIATSPNPCHSRFLDPACGSGQFLLSLYNHLLEMHTARGISVSEASEYIIAHQITGFDIDPLAVHICRTNLSRVSGIDASRINIHTLDFLFQQNLMKRDEEIFDLWDIILGNPPWGSALSAEEKRHALSHYTSASSGINTFTLFIERAHDYITRDGIIGFLLPEAYLNIKAHRKSREMVLASCAIEEITLWGEKFKGVFAPSISMIMKRQENAGERHQNIVKIRNEESLADGTAIMIPQAAFHRTHESIFNIHYTKKCVNLLSLIEEQDCFYLKGNSRFYLGIVTGNNQKHISPVQSPDFPDPILLGKDLEQYRINFSNNYFRYSREDLQQVAPQQLYRAKNKILYKFIGKRLTFAEDREGYYSLNNINGFIPENHPLSTPVLVSLLNSDLMQYYYENSFFTLKVLRGNLEKLPLKIIKKGNQERIEKLAEQLSGLEEESAALTRQNIEDIIFSEYKIKDRKAYVISRG